MLIRGAFHLILISIFLIFYGFSEGCSDGCVNNWNNDYPVHTTLKEMFDGIYENGFPYLLIIPSYLANDLLLSFSRIGNALDRLYQL